MIFLKDVSTLLLDLVQTFYLISYFVEYCIQFNIYFQISIIEKYKIDIRPKNIFKMPYFFYTGLTCVWGPVREPVRG